MWHEILNDSKFHDMPLDQQARWYNLLVYISCHGDNGTAEIEAPAKMLCTTMQCANFDELVSKLSCLVNVKTVEISHAKLSVTFSNWSKYQVDSTASERKARQRKRANVTPQEKEKEKEKEEDKDKEKERGRKAPDPRVREIIYYFSEQCSERLGFKPAIGWQKDGAQAKLALREMSLDEIKRCIDFYLPSQKANDFGCTLSIALSTNTINQFKQKEKSHGKSRADQILESVGLRERKRDDGLCRRSNRPPGSNNKPKASGRGDEVLDGEAIEIPEVADS